jgi:catechol 2,3-dioxygenase-like lactoylglutathione lyase family enzyme
MTGAGYASDGEPGPRPEYTETYYGGFVLDPDGNSIEAVHHDRSRTDGIDHVWLRTSDVATVRDFYELIAPSVGIELVRDQPDLVRFSDGAGSFTFVLGDEPTENVHLAFGVHDRDPVAAFYRLATDAGYPDNGPPGERPHYHPGYHAAFVIGPHGHNVEAVFHDRSS